MWGKHLAFDGRQRGTFSEGHEAHLGVPGKSKSLGCLFFAIERTSARQDANMLIDYVSVPLTSTIVLPNGKRHKVSCSADDMPKIPVLTNPEPIKAKQHLMALDDQILAAARLKIKQQEQVVGCQNRDSSRRR